MQPEILFYFLLFIIAFLYSSVGHGGASGYLALMVFFSVSPATMRPTALILNIFVSAIAFFKYYQNGFFRWNLFWPFAVASVPAAFIGGMFSISDHYYKMILGIFLLISVARFMFSNDSVSVKSVVPNKVFSFVIGIFIGLLSGMIGIGGGIILSPIILLLHWADLKQTAAVSALFIFVNSISGLSGLLLGSINFSSEIIPMAVTAILGGWLGSASGAEKFNTLSLKIILALVLIVAALKLILT